MAYNANRYVSPYYNSTGGSQRQCSVCLKIAQNGHYFECPKCPEYAVCIQCIEYGGGNTPHHHTLNLCTAFEYPGKRPIPSIQQQVPSMSVTQPTALAPPTNSNSTAGPLLQPKSVSQYPY